MQGITYLWIGVVVGNFLGEQVEIAGAGDSLGAAANAQFAVNLVGVPLDRADGENETFSNLAVGKSLRNQAQNFAFTFCERIQNQLSRWWRWDEG